MLPLLLGIYTAAMEMLGGGEAVKANCRTVDIMSDAAYVMLTRDSRQYTGNFAIDDDILREVGVTNFDQYLCVPGLCIFLFSLVSVFWLYFLFSSYFDVRTKYNVLLAICTQLNFIQYQI